MIAEGVAVECIGTCSIVDLWEMDTLPTVSSPSLGTFRNSVIGNDAIIVAHQLSVRGFTSVCCLLDPTSADVAMVKARMPADCVRTIGEKTGKLTRSLCLERGTGERLWVFSRRHSPNGHLDSTKAKITYADMYPELVDFFNHGKNVSELAACETFVNLSALQDPDSLKLAFQPSVVQTSVPATVGVEHSMRLAEGLLKQTGAHMVFVTLGSGGATLGYGSDCYHLAPPFIAQGNILGAGAVFSSVAIEGILQQLHCRDLLEFSVRRTASILQTWNRDADIRP